MKSFTCRCGWLCAIGMLLMYGSAALFMTSGALGQLRDPPDPERPVATTFKVTASNEVVSGDVTAWNRASVFMKLKDGTERKVGWREILPQQAYDLRRKLMDTKSANEWLDLGALMLAVDSQALADRAFAMAIKAEERAKPLSITCQAAKRRGADPQEALNDALIEEHEAREKLNEPKEKQDDQKPATDEKKPESPPGKTSGRPGGGGKDADQRSSTPDYSKGETGTKPWPEPSAADQARAMTAMRSMIDASFKKNGVRLRSKESEHFVLYSILGDSDVRNILAILESTYSTLGPIFGFDAKSNIFLGKCVVFVFSERDAFIEFELDFYHNPRAAVAGGYCHPMGPMVSLCFYRAPDEQYFLTTITHETTHAVAYRAKTPAQLPTWANEGIADFISGQLCVHSNYASEQWQHAHAFALQKKDPMTVVRQSYKDGTWYNEDSYPLSHMMTRYLIKRDQAAYRAWFGDIKEGKDWKDAMTNRFGAPVEQVMSGFIQDIRGEKSFTRVMLKPG